MKQDHSSRLESLKDQVIRVFQGNNWVTDGMLQRLNEISGDLAFEPFPYFNHTVAKLVAHIIAWKIFVIKRLEGDNVYDIEQDSETDWPEPSSWEQLKEEFSDTHKRLIKAIENFDDENLDKKVAGRSYTFNFMLQGLVHHDYYHYGQVGMMISALKRKADQDASPLV